ncbi:MAG: polysaccharide biosynthesis protein PslG [Thermoleophilaceae bacterium]|nr:polysaccharide biosynthesis protein PslG [Thermoleophilaceae bacterium]
MTTRVYARPFTPLRALGAVALLVLALAPATSQAAPQTSKKAIWGPAVVDGKSQFPLYKDLGVGIYQRSVAWDKTASRRPANPTDPSDPAYDWPADLDGIVAAARGSGMDVLIEVQSTPGWANGGKPSSYAPKRPGDVAAFMTALSRRYPAVRYWMIWSEPTRNDRFLPMPAERRGHPLTRRQQRAPRLYARVLDASYAALKSVDGGDQVVGGNTFTSGVISPRNWIRYLRLPNGKPPRMDLYGHNPFTARPPDLKRRRLSDGFADFSDLDTLHGWVRHSLRRGGQTPKLYLSEFFTPTDHPNYEFNFWVSRKTQARWLGAAMRIVRHHGYIHTMGVFAYDDPPRPGGDEVNRGLLTYDGHRKRAYRAFRSG